MPSVIGRLSINFTQTASCGVCGVIYTNSEELQQRLVHLGFSLAPMGMGDRAYTMCEIEEPEGSERLTQVRQALLDAGLQECRTSVLPRRLGRTHFAIKYIREFSKKELNQAEYLLLNVSGLRRIADWKATNETGYVLEANPRLQNLEFGWLDVVIVPYVNHRGREQLESAGLAGLSFRPAQFDRSEEVRYRLFELTSTVIMPRCLLPFKNQSGEKIAEDNLRDGRFPDDEGYSPAVLKFHRAEVEKLQPFDIAVTREWIGGGTGHYRRYRIVSQRFRQQLIAMKVKSVSFIPVELK